MQSDKNINTNLASQSYWDEAYAGYSLQDKVADDDIVKKWLLKYIPKVNGASCMEIGCFPGRYLTVMGDLGYKLSGIDLTPRVKNEFPAWLKKEGYDVGSFSQEDFLKFNPQEKYDMVCSFGFIEHFTNWQEVFLKHIELVNDNGYLVIETPNFRGWFQRFIHWFLDNENYKRHYIPSMNPDKWAKLCEKHGFEIIFKGHIGEFQFWVDKLPTTYVRTKVFNRLITNYEKLKSMKPGKPAYAPYCGIIARKKK
ncbi:MAG: class I SAM-dependent methyltransferase [Bacteroidota bacterium]|nr:class I SAM-dependent methyltransferase [Bacteroidota bacterium]